MLKANCMAGTWQCHSPDLELNSRLKDRLTNLTRASQIPWERGFIADPMNLFTPRPRVSQSKIFEVNPLPRSCLIASGNEWVVITLSRRALAVDLALVLFVIINSTYIEKQSTTTNTYFGLFPFPPFSLFSGPKWSIHHTLAGPSGVDGERSLALYGLRIFMSAWHIEQLSISRWASPNIPGHQNCNLNLATILSTAMCASLCTSLIKYGLNALGT